MKNNLTGYLILLLVVIVIVFAGYFDGRYEERKSRTELENKIQSQRSVDSLKSITIEEANKYINLSDSVSADNKTKNENFLMIQSIKNLLLKNFKKQNEKIDQLTDSALFIVHDSIMVANGIK